jgi:periplasmic protein TonB
MFEDSLLESAGKLKTRTRYTTMLSFGLQIFIIGILVLIPLIYTEALPAKAMMTMLVAPPPPPPPPPPPAQVVKVQKITTEIVDGALRTPTKIPEKIKKIVEEEAPATTMGVPGAVGGVPGGSAGGVLGGVLSAANATPPRVQPQRIRVSSGVAAGRLINKVQPVYPPIAKQARVQGKVILQAQISKQGTIEGLKVVSGHPMLTQAALDAVSRWRYQPYILNGEPVEVDTQVEVTFTLQGGS